MPHYKTSPSKPIAGSDAAAAGDIGNLALAVRQDSLSALASDGQYAPLVVNASGALYVAMSGTITIGSLEGETAHDAAASGTKPVLTGGYSSAAAPSDVSGDGDAVNAWFLRNGAQATVITAAGALIGGDATNGLDVDITRLPTDLVFTDDAAFTPATSKVLAVGFQADETSADSVDEGDIGCARMTLDRRLRVASKATDGPGEPTIDSYGHVAINLTTGADQVLVSSAANKQIWIYGFGFTVGDAAGQTVSLQDQDDVAVTGIMEFAQYGGMCAGPSGNFAMPLFKLGTDKDLEIDITGGDVDGWLCYAIVSV